MPLYLLLLTLTWPDVGMVGDPQAKGPDDMSVVERRRVQQIPVVSWDLETLFKKCLEHKAMTKQSGVRVRCEYKVIPASAWAEVGQR